MASLILVFGLARFGVTGCLFHRWVGLPCPTCGTTRALEALCGGRWLLAFEFNPLAALVAILGVLALVLAPLWTLRGWPIPISRTPWPLALRVGLGISVLANWAYLLVREAGR